MIVVPPSSEHTGTETSYGEMMSVSLTRMDDFGCLAEKWRELETRADPSFFTTWTWTGCQVEQRFRSPILLEVRRADQHIALALLNRRGSWRSPETMWLGESGDPLLDAIFIEHNGFLAARDAPSALLAGVFEALFRAPIAPASRRRRRRLIMSGVSRGVRDAISRATPHVRITATRDAPAVDLTATAQSYLDGLSSNTRYQIRRSGRRYTEVGPLTLERADTAADAHRFLDALAALHQITWRRRGHPGAFANPRFTAFHHALLDRGFDRDEIDLLRIAAGRDTIGYLYNLRYRGCVCAYQSGFAYEGTTPHHKPGLTAHHLAIEHYIRQGCVRYDFLGGDSRYKVSLANACETLFWVDAMPRDSVLGRIRSTRDLISDFAVSRKASSKHLPQPASASASKEP